MQYSESGFELTVTDNVLAFSGKLEKSDYTVIDDFLRRAAQTLRSETCVIELTRLTFLNSSGIKCLATFMLGSPKQFEIRVNKNVTWQAESIPALAMLKPNDITIVS